MQIRQKRVFQPERIQLGRALRNDKRPAMKRRRVALALTLGSTALLGILGSYQTGLIKRLPDPPIRRFKAAAVSSSGEGYLFGIPDALLGIVNYALTASVIFAGPPDRAESKPIWPLLAMGKTWFDAGNGLRLAKVQAFDLHLYCAYCLGITAFTLGTVPLLLPEGMAAARNFFTPRDEQASQYAA